jgi:16S rRNA (guanine(966)-N(2))-methyltransferase RsmD
MTRIISGRLRGKIIRAPGNLPVRPTTDFAKESLFNILNNHFVFENIKALDLFAGTGNLSYELASRGCEDIIAVDLSNRCHQFIEKTAKELGFEGLKSRRANALDFVKREYREYDLIIADPPYDYEEYAALIEAIFSNDRLSKDGMLVIEHDSKGDLSESKYFFESRKYGKVRFTFFQFPEESESEPEELDRGD